MRAASAPSGAGCVGLCLCRSCSRRVHRSCHMSIHSVGVKDCKFVATLLQQVEFLVNDLLNDSFTARCLRGMWAPPRELRCRGSEQLRKYLCPGCEAQLDVHIDGCNPSEEVCVGNPLCPLRWTSPVFKSMTCSVNSQVWGGSCGRHHEGSQMLGTSLSVRQLRTCRWRLKKSALRAHLTLEIESW